MQSPTGWKQIVAVFVLLLGAGISLLWALALERGPHAGVMGFPGIYFGTRCLLQGCDPYHVPELERVYAQAGARPLNESAALHQSVTLYVNIPSTFLLVAPFALLPLGTAQVLWSSLVVSSFFLASLLTWIRAKQFAPDVAVILTFLLLANCEIIFAGGNTAGLVVSLCVLSVYCLLGEQLVAIGVIALAISLAIKPHDGGLIWLYFLFAGPVHRRRAIVSAVLALTMTVGAVIWVSHVAPHWLPELRSNLSAISAPGGINEPGPTSIGVNSPDMIIDLQTVFSVFVDDPSVYNIASYVVCATILALWLVTVRRTANQPKNALFALVSVATLSMLVTYHRSYDAKLLLLSIPACAMLWAERRLARWGALALSAAGILITGDIPLTLLTHVIRNLHSYAGGLGGKLEFVFLARPAPLVLLAISIFYLWVTFKRAADPAMPKDGYRADLSRDPLVSSNIS
jgi:hypothetical protein